jgi:hypothetical protein
MIARVRDIFFKGVDMLKNKYITTKWNSKTKKYYTDLGYIFTRMGSDLIILLKHLPQRSQEKIFIECHMSFHIEFGKKDNNPEQINIFLQKR